MNTRTGGGGAATQAGINYQNRVAAWAAVQILAEQDASPLWGLPADSTLEFLRCETEQPVDDLLIGTSAGGHLFIQVKHSLNLETTEQSALASAINQFVRQFNVYRGAAKGNRPWERMLDQDRDRLILITSPGSSAPIREHLPLVLRRLRTLAHEQMIEQAATTDPEQAALRVVREHLSRAWLSEMGSEPSDQDTREMLSLLRIQILDADEGGDAEREAKNLLRSIVLKDPVQADSAWNSLVQACALYATTRNGADRSGLQHVLLTAGIGLNAPRSFRDDIERLKRYSQGVARSAADLSRIRVGPSEEVKIDRPSTQALRDAAERESLVVVGEPGAGKSGALHDLVESLQAEGRDVIYLAVDRLEAKSLGALRNELGLTHEVHDILRNWPGERPGFLITDALDAARSDQAAQTLRELLADTLNQSGRWRVIASIRKFDLRHDKHLRKLFAGQPPTEFRDQEFLSIRHLNVPPLTGQELADACRQSPSLAELIRLIVAGEHNTLLTLLTNPFNLRLVGELLDAGIGVESLAPIRTQIELLDQYWKERVIRNDYQGDAREAVLRRAVEKMVEARSLRIDRAEVANDLAASAHLMDLQSAHLLVDWQPSPEASPNRYILTFAHHLLFDYAVARLLLRGDTQRVITRLERDAELVVAIRPSLILHFQHEWLSEPDRRSFWNLAFRLIGSPVIPEVGKLIGPSVAAELITDLSDYQPLVDHLEDRDSAAQQHGEQALRHLTRSLLITQGSSARPLVGNLAPPWCELLERCTRSKGQVAYTICPLLMSICDHPERLTPGQLDSTGKVARRLLEFAWAQSPPDQWLVIHGLQAVSRTFGSDVTASAELMRRCLEPEHLAKYKYFEMPQLADAIEMLVEHDPVLVEEIYRTAFTHSEESDEKTPIGGSPLLNLVSTRSQDYKRALWVLAGNYRCFLERAPLQATRAMVIVLDDYVTARHLRHTSNYEAEESFDFNGSEARIKTDHSEIWDSGSAYRDDEPLRMLDIFTEYLKQFGGDTTRAGDRRALIDVIVTQNRHAVLWRRLLECGAAVPETLGREIRFLGWAMPVLTGYDTTRVVGDYLEKVFSLIESSDRERIERAILSIPTTVDEERREDAERERDRLLGCLPLESIVTEEAKTILQQLETQGGAPSNEPLHRFSAGAWGPPTDEYFLARQGVPVDAEPNRHMQEIARPVQEFAERHFNTSPTGQDIDEVLPRLHILREAVMRADELGVHPKQKDYAWGNLITACEVITRTETLICSGEAGRLVREVLLEGARHPDPVHHPENDAHFDEHQGWGIPAPRVDAAQGLILLARESSCADREVLDAIEQLSRDDVPAVRFQIARHLNVLYYTAPHVMWEVIERMCSEERSRGVLQGLLRGTLDRLAGPHMDRIAGLVKIVFDRITDGSGGKEVRRLCTTIFTNLYLWRDQSLAQEAVFAIADDPSRYTDEAHKITFILRNPLTHGSAENSKADDDAIRKRALSLMERVLSATSKGLNRLQAQHQNVPFASWPVQEQEEARRLVHLADGIATEVYFASGAFDDQMRDDGDVRPPLGDSEKRRFLQEASTLLDVLADLGIPHVAHNLVKTLEYLIEFDPAGVFLKVGRVVHASRDSQYKYDPMAADVIVSLINRFLAEYRHVLREREECRRALIEVLNIFVEVGWPSAMQLAYRVEEMYR